MRCFRHLTFFVAAMAISGMVFCQQTDRDATRQLFNTKIDNGVAAARKGDFRTAEEVFRSAVSLRPHDPRGLTALGQAQEELGKYLESEDTFREVLRLDPTSPEAHVNLAIALADQGSLASALEETTSAIRLDPNSSAAHLMRGRLMSDLKRPAEARTEFRLALKYDPRNVEALRNWAALEEDEGDKRAQGELLRRYIQFRPTDADAQCQYGMIMESEGQGAMAIAALRKAIKLNPEYREAIYALARAVERTDPEEARALFQRVQYLSHDQQIRDRVRLLGNQANAEMAESNYAAAIADLQHAIALCGKCDLLGALDKNLGLAYCHKGQLDSCERELKKAKLLIPGDPDVALALRIAQRNRDQALDRLR